MDRDLNGFRRALAVERERNSRQIAAFRFYALATVLVLQLLFALFVKDWTGAPMGPMLGYTAVAALAWRLHRRSGFGADYPGYVVAALDIPMVYWLVRATARATLASPEPELAGPVLMMLPLTFAGFLVMASLALDTWQTLAVAAVALVLQSWALLDYGRDATFVSLVSAFTVLIAAVCVYWREQSVRLVRKTSDEQLRRERLGRYFSPVVARLVQSGALAPGGERRQVTVLFADLRGFTRIAEDLDPGRVVVLLNRFHAAMVEAVFRHGGTLDKYLGDGLMAYFGAPVPQDDQAERAMRCALDMQRELARLEASGLVPGGAPLRMGIGVHTGVAIVGDIGAESRREFTVIGDAVNVAARLEQLTKEMDRPVLVSGATAAAAAERIPCERVGTVSLRGRVEPVDVFVPTAVPG